MTKPYMAARFASGTTRVFTGVRPGGSFVQDGKVEVAVDDERKRARDGRGRHHQHVGALALFAELGALAHAEAVLFVGDDEAKILIGNALGDERVGAEDHVPFAA